MSAVEYAPYLRLVDYGQRPQSCFAKSTPQPSSLTRSATTNFEVIFMSPSNRVYLRTIVPSAISDADLLPVMDEAVGWYTQRHMTDTYGPETRDELQRALDIMNKYTVERVSRLYDAQDRVARRWNYLQHRHEGMNVQAPSVQSDYDRSTTMY